MQQMKKPYAPKPISKRNQAILKKLLKNNTLEVLENCQLGVSLKTIIKASNGATVGKRTAMLLRELCEEIKSYSTITG